MIQYIVEAIAFQLVFLVIYDLFLKRETFFQWNRLYLIGTYTLSLVLPWVKIEALKTTVSQQYYVYPEFLWNMEGVTVTPSTTEGFLSSLPWSQVFLFGGMVAAALLFAFKLYKIQQLRNKGRVQYFPNFTRIVVRNSSLAFSFFRSIFMGDKVLEKEHESIIRHELVHIEQKHSWDLIFFELMRIGSWFNPLVYVYQSRIAELHEFIADAEVARIDKKESYQLLLSEVFQTQHISFINQFFKSSLTRLNVFGKIISFGSQYGQVKKRIVMLQKSKSKSIWKLKYLALVPLVGGMLFYTSCENEAALQNGVSSEEAQNGDRLITVGDIENLTQEEENKVYSKLKTLSESGEHWELQVKDAETVVSFVDTEADHFISGMHNEPIRAQMSIDYKDSQKLYKNFMGSNGASVDWKELYKTKNVVPFVYADQSPIFPGCEDESDPRECFNKMMQRHISKNFRYPQKAQEQGIQGRVSVMFTIVEDGTIQDIRMRGPHVLLEEEVGRIITKLPKMTPGKLEGKNVKIPYSIPITFKLQQASFNPGSESSQNSDEGSAAQRLVMDEFMAAMDAVPFAQLDEAPVFPGCENAVDKRACFTEKIQRHISKNFLYPETAQVKGIQGRVAILFTINKDGNIDNIKYRGPDPSLEAEAERIIRKLPRMTAGKRNGSSVSAVYAIPITFKLQ